MSRLPSAPDELALAGAEHLDADYVAAYDRKAQFDPAPDLVELQERGLGSGSTLIDLGAGTGTFAVAAASVCKRVIAVDVSPAMIDAIRAKADAAGFNNIEFIQAGFLTYEHRGLPPEFIFTRNALHHLPDFWKARALRRMATLLPADGVLRLRDLVFSFDLAEAESRVEAWLDAAPSLPEQGWTRKQLEEHLRDEHSTFSWLLEPMIERAGFRIDSVEYASNGFYAAYTLERDAEALIRTRDNG